MTTTPLTITFPILLGSPLAPLEAFSQLRRYIVMGRFDHEPNLLLLFTVQSNLHELAEVLIEVIQSLNSKIVFKNSIDYVSTDDDS